MYLNVRSPANLGYYRRGVPSPSNLGRVRPRRRRLRGLGQIDWTSWIPSPMDSSASTGGYTAPSTFLWDAITDPFAAATEGYNNYVVAQNAAENQAALVDNSASMQAAMQAAIQAGTVTQAQAQTLQQAGATAPQMQLIANGADDPSTVLDQLNSVPGVLTPDQLQQAYDAAAAGTPPPWGGGPLPSPSLSDWLSQNWVWVALGGAALFLVWPRIEQAL